MDNVTNPANWLLGVWHRMPRSTDMNMSILHGWAATFGYSKSDLAVIRSLGAVSEAVGATVELVGRLAVSERKREHLLKWTSAFEEAQVDFVQENRWVHVTSRFTEARRVHLEHCAIELDAALPNSKSRDEVATYATRISQLLDELVADDSLEREFKTLVADVLEAARRSFAEYAVRGNAGVMEALSHLLATLLKYHEHFDSPPRRRWAEKLREVIGLTADVATVTGITAPAVGGGIAGLLSKL